MMDNGKKNQVLFDYLSGLLSPEEMDGVERWLEECGENRAYFAAFRQDFLSMRWGLRVGLVKGTFREVERRRRLRVFGRVLMRAAMVACVLGAGLMLYVHRGSGAGDAAGTEEIVPGGMQAVLVLSSGKRVVLDGSERQLTEANGAAVYVDAEGAVRYAGSEAAKDEVLYNVMTTPRGGEYAIVLEDSTKVYLNAGTELRYPVYFSGKRREVYLKGEAYFEVARNEERPFVVHAGGADVTVYGTCFNVDSYAPDRVETVLVEGQVGMSDGLEEVRLVPGQKGTVTAAAGGSGIRVEEVDVYAYVAWKDGNFVFDDERLEEIMEELGRWYDVEVFYAREGAKEERLSGDMRRYKDVRSLLYYFERISEVRFEIKGRTIIVK